MERSLAARLSRPLVGRPAAGARGSRPARRGEAAVAAPSLARRALRALGLPLRVLLARRRGRIALVCLAIALPLLGGGWMWLRHSSFVAVRQVRISGVSGPDAGPVRAALAAAARHMSTLDVRSGTLRAAVAPFAVVRGLRAIPSFPHGLRIEVTEQPPVATLVVGGTRTAVAADGAVLGPALISSSLPTLGGRVMPPSGRRLREGDLLACLTVLGAAPVPLAGLVTRAYSGPQGITLAMRSGLLAYFGDATRPHAKWLSLARVLADSSSAGASYVDVRVPGRPAAGFPAGSGPASAGEAEGGSGMESTIAALAAKLTAAGGSTTGAASAAQSTSESEGETESPTSSQGSEHSSSEGSEHGVESAPEKGG